MWRAKSIDLKLRLTFRVAGLAASCFLAASTYAMIEADRAARARVAAVAEAAAAALRLQHAQASWVKPAPVSFPDISRLNTGFSASGLCIAYRTQSGVTRQQICNGPSAGADNFPASFAFLYTHIFDPGRQVARPLDPANAALGEMVVFENPRSVIAQAWQETSAPLGVMAVTLVALCFLVHAALARALRPTRLIVGGLERLAVNDLSARLPDFDLAELSRIKDVFNHLAASLDRTVTERNELTRRLIAVQDEERQILARELHDEFGQCVAAISAMAAAAGQTARDDCPALLAECQTIQKTASTMMETLRGALIRLRHPETDRFGLVLSVENLVAGWNSRSHGATHYAMEASGGFQSLPAELASNIYRIAQEALTNAARHACATRVQLRLLRHARGCAARHDGDIELVVQDNGTLSDLDHLGRAGMGLLGMRERIAILGGRLSIEPGQPSGLILRAVIPVPLPALEAEPG
jgi:signal transduction histidine kinase